MSMLNLEHPATPQLFAAVAALQHLCNRADDLHVSPPPMWPLLLHAAVPHPMGSRAEIATAVASATMSHVGPHTTYDPTSTVTRSTFDEFSRRCAKAVFDKNLAVAICGMEAFSALLERIPSGSGCCAGLVDVSMLVSRYLTMPNDMPNFTLQHAAAKLLTTVFAQTSRIHDTPTMCRCLPELLHLAMHDATSLSVRRSCFAALSTAGHTSDSCWVWLQQENVFAQLVRLMDSQSCGTAVRADAMGLLLRLCYQCTRPHVPAPRYLALFIERLRPNDDSMGTTAALWGLFLQLPTREWHKQVVTHANPNPAVDACMARLSLMHSVLEGGNTRWVEPALKIFQRILELEAPVAKRLLEPVVVAARIIALIQHPHKGLRYAALMTIYWFTQLHSLHDELVRELFVALRDCLIAVPAVIPAGGDAPRSDSEDLVREAVRRVHPGAVAFFSHEWLKRVAFLTAAKLLPADTQWSRCAVDSGLFSALLQYRPLHARDMVTHREHVDAIVRGVDAAVDAVDETTWASFLAYIAEAEGEIVLRATLAVVIIDVAHGARQWDVIIALHKSLMKTTDNLCCPSNRSRMGIAHEITVIEAAPETSELQHNESQHAAAHISHVD
jgi:hypothetical protein